jgi:phosphoribosyl 1,2-cyclic phosphodiesterase
MAETTYKLRFWGARGTVPSPSAAQLRYGGNTSCLAVSLGEREHVILDCGSGLRRFGASLPPTPDGLTTRFHIFLSHYHFDHTEGLPLFQPLFDKRSTIRIHGPASCGMDVKQILQGLIRPPYFPVTLADVPSSVEYVDNGGSGFKIRDVAVDSLPLNHPDGCVSYRLRRGDRTIVYATDHEHGEEATDRALVEFSRGAAHLIYDATYEPAEYEELRRGWGHSTWYAAVRTALTAEVENLILFHHHPDHTDDELDGVLEFAQREFPNTTVSHEGLELSL